MYEKKFEEFAEKVNPIDLINNKMDDVAQEMKLTEKEKDIFTKKIWSVI